MANIKRNEPVVQVIKPATYTLELTENEIRGLKTLLGEGTSGGVPARCQLDDLWTQLYRDKSILKLPEVSFSQFAQLETFNF